MNEILFEKLDEFYSEVDDCSEIKEMIKLKEIIYNDNKLKELLDKYRNNDNKYDTELILLKKQIISNPLIVKFRELETNLYFVTLEINQKLNKLVGKKVCSNENN